MFDYRFLINFNKNHKNELSKFSRSIDSYTGRELDLLALEFDIKSTSIPRVWPSGKFSILYAPISNPKDYSSRMSTLKDSGVPGLGIGFPLTIAFNVSFLPCMSSDLTVKSS